MKFLTLRKDAAAPAPDPQAAEVRFYADEDGALRSVQPDGTDAPVGSGGGGSQPFRVVTLDVDFDTPGLVIPASGPAGIKLTDVADYETLVGAAPSDVLFPISVFTAWDGTTPRLNLTTTAGRGNLPGTPPSPFQYQSISEVDTDDSSSGAFKSAANVGDKASWYFTPATSLYCYVDDGAGADPESEQGEGRVVLLLMATQ